MAFEGEGGQAYRSPEQGGRRKRSWPEGKGWWRQEQERRRRSTRRERARNWVGDGLFGGNFSGGYYNGYERDDEDGR